MNRLRTAHTPLCVFLLSLLMVLAAAPAGARSINDAIGTTAFQWLKTVSDAGISAAGECFGAVGGTRGLFVHPAAVADVDAGTVKMSYVSHYVDSQYGALGYAGVHGDRQVGFRVNYVNYGEFVRTDKSGNRLGTFDAGDMGFTANLGTRLRDDLRAGIMVSYITSKLEDFSAQAVSADIGVLYEPDFEGLTVGAALMNVGTLTKAYSSGYDDTLPTRLVVGFQKTLSHAPITLLGDIIFPNDNDIIYAFGAKLSLQDTFFLYAGTRSRNKIDTEIEKAETDFGGMSTFGVGMTFDNYRFNYAYSPDDILGDVHKATLGVGIP